MPETNLELQNTEAFVGTRFIHQHLASLASVSRVATGGFGGLSPPNKTPSPPN